MRLLRPSFLGGPRLGVFGESLWTLATERIAASILLFFFVKNIRGHSASSPYLVILPYASHPD